ncbi:MAG: hypothetical protein RLZZ352_724 [Pseudomonadota bacterium]
MADAWALYRWQPSFVLGFHGTDKSVVDAVVSSPDKGLKKSDSATEWLGHGVYFWENDPARALDWAANGKTKGKVTEPSVVGAIIDLGYCLDLTTISGLEEVKQSFEMLREAYERAGIDMPVNVGGKDRLRRELDCAVIQALHQYRNEQGLAPYESVRAPFPEAEDLYRHSGFRAKNHIQVCVINTARCIKGYFKPIRQWG